jgi:hypothetical protein
MTPSGGPCGDARATTLALRRAEQACERSLRRQLPVVRSGANISGDTGSRSAEEGVA